MCSARGPHSSSPELLASRLPDLAGPSSETVGTAGSGAAPPNHTITSPKVGDTDIQPHWNTVTKDPGAAHRPTSLREVRPKHFHLQSCRGLELQIGDYGSATSAPAKGGTCLPDPRGPHADDGADLTSRSLRPPGTQRASGLRVRLHLSRLKTLRCAQLPVLRGSPVLKDRAGTTPEPCTEPTHLSLFWPSAPCQSPEKPQRPPLHQAGPALTTADCFKASWQILLK